MSDTPLKTRRFSRETAPVRDTLISYSMLLPFLAVFFVFTLPVSYTHLTLPTT